MHRSADPAAVQRRIALALMAGDEEQNPFATGNCALKRTIDRDPCSIQSVAMQVEDSVWLDLSGTKPPIPAAIQRR